MTKSKGEEGHRPGNPSQQVRISAPIESQKAEQENFLFDLFFLLRKRFAIFFSSFLIIVGFGAVLGMFSSPIYRSFSSLILERPPVQNDWQYYNEDNEIKNAILVLTSPGLLREAVEKSGISTDALRLMNVKGVREKDSNVIDVTIEDPDARRLKTVFPKFIELFSGKIHDLENQKQDKKTSFIRSQVKIIEEEIKAVDKALQQFLEREEVISISERLEKLNDELQKLRDERGDLEGQQKNLAESLKIVKNRSQELSKNAGGYDTTFQELVDLKASLFNLTLERTKLLSTYQESHPEVQTVDEQIKFIQSQINAKSGSKFDPGAADRSGQVSVIIFQKLMEIETDQKNLILRVARNEANLVDKTQTFKNLSKKLEEYNALMRRQKVSEQIHSSLIEKLNQAEIDRGTQVATVKILSEPTEPRLGGRLDFKVILLVSVVLGLFGGLIMANLQETMDSSLKSPEEAHSYLGLQILGKIPDLKKILALPPDSKIQTSPTVVTVQQRNCPESEAFRSMRAALVHQSKKRPFKSILLTSGASHIGKTTVVVNLAAVYAQSGSKVILVDGDLRKPSVHHHFFLSNHRGLSDAFLGEPLEKLLEPSFHENLRIITSGPTPPNPPELFGADAMNDIIDSLTQMADLVIFDMPPLLAVSDALVLSGKVDAVLYLVPLNRGSGKHALRALEQLRLVEAPVIGMINNFVKSDDYEGYYYQYYSRSERK